MPNVNILGQIMKEEFGLGAVRQIVVFVTLTLDSNVISVISTRYMNSLLFLHPIGNQCTKYERPQIGNEEKVCGIMAVRHVLTNFKYMCH